MLDKLNKSILEGNHMSAMNLDEAEEHTCLNCGTTFRGNYCPHCRQKASTKRLTTSDSVKNVVSKFVTLDSGLLHTIINLIYRPGYMVRDYLKGHRVEYVEPLMLLFLLLAIDYLFPGEDGTTNFPERWAALKDDYPFAHRLMSVGFWMFSDLQRALVVICILISPAVTLLLKLLRLKEKALNLSESFHALLYSLCYFGVMVIVVDTIDLFVPVPDAYANLVIGLMFVVFCAIIRACTGISWPKMSLFVVIFPFLVIAFMVLYMGLYIIILRLNLPKEVFYSIDPTHF